MSEQIPETWAELSQAIAFKIGWKLCKYNVTPEDRAWNTEKAMRGPKWYVQSPFGNQMTVCLRATKVEALADLPLYDERRKECRDILAVLPRQFWPSEGDAHSILLAAADYFKIEYKDGAR